MEKRNDVFISYRRDTGHVVARLLQQELEKKGLKVFFDLEELRTGDFNAKIYDSIDESKYVIILLSNGALDRCVNENDWVRLELEYAIQKGIKVVPVAPSDAPREFPKILPPSLECLRKLQISSMNLVDLFSESIQKIIEDQLRDCVEQKNKEAKENEGMFLRMARNYKENDGIIDDEERLNLYDLAQSLGLTKSRRDELIDQIEKEYDEKLGTSSQLTSFVGKETSGYDIFLSYRRDGGASDARLFYDHLTKFGFSVSYDMDNLGKGNFNEELLQRVACCKNYIILLSKDCFKRTLEGCKREDDWLRLELATALYHKKNIIAVMLPGFEFPVVPLPPDIDDIRHKNGPKYDYYFLEPFFDRLRKDFLIDIQGNSSMGSDNPTANDSPSDNILHEVLSSAEMTEGEYDDSMDDIFGDDSLYWQEEANNAYTSISRVIPFETLENLDKKWDEAETLFKNGSRKHSTRQYMEVIDAASKITPCVLPFATRLVGDGIDVKSKNWFNIALGKAQNGDADYQFGIGTLYEQGIGIRQDIAAAFRWFQQAASQNHIQAIAAVGAAYASGKGVEANYPAAYQYLTEAAEKDIPFAFERLGYLYENGLGVPQDDMKAAEMYGKGAEQGNPEAMVALGIMCENQRGIVKDTDAEINLKNAFAWYQNASARDFPLGKRKMAEFLFWGKGVEANHAEAIKLCRAAVTQGDVDSLALLGHAYEEGWGVEKDVQKAHELYKKAVDAGSALGRQYLSELEAEIQLRNGLKYVNGDQVPIDLSQAYMWFTKAAKQDNAEAMEKLAYLLEHGLGCDFNSIEAKSWYEKAADKGNVAALVGLGKIYFRGYDEAKDYTRALGLFKRAANGWKNADSSIQWKILYAFFYLGRIYMEGLGVPKNTMLGLRCLVQGARYGNLCSARYLGDKYRTGDGVAISKETAEKWYKTCLDLEEKVHFADDMAMHTLAAIYKNGYGTSKNPTKAGEWFRRAAELHNVQSLDWLGDAYQNGECGFEKNPELAMKYYEIAAECGYSDAQYDLGMMYYSGTYVNSEKAFDWLKKASEKGHRWAMEVLHRMYKNGEGTEKNDAEALNWIQKSADAQYGLALATLGEYYEKGMLGLPIDNDKAVTLYRQAAAQGSDKGYYEFCRCLWNECYGLKKDMKQILPLLNKINFAKYSQFAPLLIDVYYGNDDFTKNEEEYNAIAPDDNSTLLWKLYFRYKYGRGVDKNPERALECLTASAKRGNNRSQNSLGWAHYLGDGVEQDFDKAFSWTMAAVQNGNAHGMETLFRMYRDGTGVVQNPEEALRWLEKASSVAENKSYGAVFELGECYENGWYGLTADKSKAVELYKSAADNNNNGGLYNLGRCYLYGIGVEINLANATSYLMKASKIHDTNSDSDDKAFSLLEGLYFDGNGFESNEEKYHTLSPRVNMDILLHLGEKYEQGDRVQKNTERSMQCYTAAANRGSDIAINKLALINYNHNNIEKTLEWCKKGVQLKSPGSMVLLHRLYREGGNGIEPNAPEAYKYLKRALALKAGYADMGECLENGLIGIEKNPEEAFRYYRLAADKKITQGQGFYHLGRCLLYGIGTKANAKDALTYLKMASDTVMDLVGCKEKAMRLLVEIFNKGTEGIPKDEGKAAQWQNKLDEYVTKQKEGAAENR